MRILPKIFFLSKTYFGQSTTPGMPASPGVQRAATRVCGSVVLACALVVLAARARVLVAPRNAGGGDLPLIQAQEVQGDHQD
jgi:hypothetical protein